MIRLYQRVKLFHLPIFKTLFLSDRACRFRPSCSQYAHQAISKYGIIKGGWLSFKRILKCHPWSQGGWDPVE